MGFEIAIEEARTGIVTNYHRITRADIDYDHDTVEIEVSGYASKEMRDKGKGAIGVERVNIAPDAVRKNKDLIETREGLYILVKKQDKKRRFDDAKDILE